MDTIKFRWLAEEIDLRNSTDIDYPLMSVSQTKGVIPRSELMGNEGRAESLEKYKVCHPGQIVINRMSASSGALGLADQFGLISPDYAVLNPTPLVDPKYLEYLMRSTWFIGEMVARLKGIGTGGESASVRTPRISISDLGDVIVPYPSLQVQRKVTQYLNEQVNIIDKAIELKKATRFAYYEAYNSDRHQLVSGFLKEPKVFSNLDWIPQAPKSWEKLPLRALFSWNKGKDPARLDNNYCASNPGEFPVYSGQTSDNGVFAWINTFDFSFSFKCTLVSTVGAQAGSMRVVSDKFSLSQNCALLIPRGLTCSPEYLNYLWPSIWSSMKSKIPSDMQPSLRLSDLSDTWLYLPPEDEQKKIVETLSIQETRLLEIDTALKESILRLEELKASMITSAVTGLIDISNERGVAS